MSPSDFHLAVIAFCFRWAGSVTSFGRSPAHNATVGGLHDDPHVFWLGADVVYAPAPLPPLPLAQADAKNLGLTLIREGDHDHLQPAGWIQPA